MKWVYKVIRTILVCIVALLLGIPAVIYVMLSLPFFQSMAGHEAERRLSELLGVNVSIGRVEIAPFNRVLLTGIVVSDSTALSHGPIATIDRLGAGINLFASLRTESVVINYVELMGLNAHLWRADKDSPLNIDPIIKALSPKDKEPKPMTWTLAVNSVVIRKTAVAYDILSEPQKPAGIFDAAHVAVSDFSADIRIPRIAQDDYAVDIRRLTARERSGLELALRGRFEADSTHIAAEDFSAGLNSSHISFAPIDVRIRSLKTLGTDFRTLPVSIVIERGSEVRLADLAPFVPALAASDAVVGLALTASGTVDDFEVSDLTLGWQGGRGTLTASARIAGVTALRERLAVDQCRVRLVADGGYVARQLSAVGRPGTAVMSLLDRAGEIRLDASGQYTPAAVALDARLQCAVADVAVRARADGNIPDGSYAAEAEVDVAQCDLSVLGPKAGLGELVAAAQGSVTVSSGKCAVGEVDLDVARIDWHGHRWDDVTLAAVYDGHNLTADIDSSDSEAQFKIRGDVAVSDYFKQIGAVSLTMDVDRLSLDMLPVGPKWRDYDVALTARADFDNVNLASMEGNALIEDMTLTRGDAEPVAFGSVSAEVHNSREPMWARVESEFVDVELNGSYDFKTIGRDVRNAVARVYPSLVTPVAVKPGSGPENIFKADVTLKDSRRLEEVVKLPVNVVHPVEINIYVDAQAGSVALSADAPYLLQKNKVIENSSVHVAIDGATERSAFYLTTVMPTKNGPMALTLDGVGGIDRMDTQLLWDVDGPRAFYGTLDLGAAVARGEDGTLLSTVDIRESEMVLNDALWTVHPARVSIAPRRVEVADWRIGHDDSQYLTIDGVASDDPDDVARLQLSDIDLDYIFDTLNIPNVDFGGRATGTVTVRDAFGGAPVAMTDNLHVKGLKYNDSLFGDALIASSWDNAEQAVTLDADITQANGGGSTVDGAIWPVKDGGRLDLRFGADRTGIGFLRPFMSAFCSNITGEVSGNARLFGTFSDLDLEGDAYVKDMRITIPFTNTTYAASDSVHFRPGNIELQGLTLTDEYGNKAKFSGWLKHRYFHDPVFDFRLYDARDFLCYSVGESDEQPWYGRIFANGGASIAGRPGVVDINVNVSTAPRSTFGFILSDSQSAGEYTFITFRDKDASVAEMDEKVVLVPDAIRKLKDQIKKESESTTVFNMSIAVETNPNVAVTLVMDPVAGDRIRAWGSGDLRMTYSSKDDDMQIFGTYVLDRGFYNFTLQDIIVKDFTIDAGSSIAFHGNPYAAQLNITAAYQTTANLTDLDESFKDDKDLNRTSVPVRALLKIMGDMRQPELAFDLDFPTLTSDIDRKVRSLVNTEEMLNRQVIYLLALNRFYTPEYNSAASRSNNEFASLATNTLSSRISSLLGTISDNWTIAPSVRSDQGDFSDMEVDLALSSHLLNNRLLINGNLGYRDKSLNTTSFIGDFDIEYLLNRSGTIRLKAYNRFNDQTFYVKSALTTQGVGVVFKRDFDNFDSWLRPIFRRKKDKEAQPDTMATPAVTPVTAPADSVK